MVIYIGLFMDIGGFWYVNISLNVMLIVFKLFEYGVNGLYFV